MTTPLLASAEKFPTPLRLIRSIDFSQWHSGLDEADQAWVAQQDFSAKAQSTVWLRGENGLAREVVVGWSGKENLTSLGGLPMSLPPGSYELTAPVSDLLLLGWCTGSYQFTRYLEPQRAPATLVVADNAQRERVLAQNAAVSLTRDLINTPAGDMLPSDLQAAAETLANDCGATITTLVGDELLERGYRTIHAVGRAADDAPRLIDMQWGDPSHPKVTLVGKGVCFDSGGLNIKPAGGMRTMKKDMGGAAQVLGLGHLIMTQQLPVRLRILVPAVENAIAGNAYRPGDIINTYAGITVEIDNTDAEGRLVLCDALALAQEEDPDLIVDFATLTGAARVAVGAEISAMFCNHNDVADAVFRAGEASDDPVWRLPLHSDYNYMLRSSVADTVNSAGGFAGATTAALFLQKFVDQDTPWLHFDIMSFNNRNRPGHPEGGEAMGIRAMALYLEQYLKKSLEQ